MGFKVDEGFAKDFYGQEVSYRTWKITALYEYRLLTTTYNGEDMLFEVKDSTDGGRTRLEGSLRVTYEDKEGRKEVVGFAPTLAFAKRLCAHHTTNALTRCPM